MKIKISIESQKASMLMRMADMTLKRLKETDTKKYPSNTLTDYYDIIHKILEAISLSDGVKIKGEGAHKELIDYVSESHGLNTSEKIFLQELREYRNRISYEGFMVTTDYIFMNKTKIEDIICKIKKIYQKISER